MGMFLMGCGVGVFYVCFSRDLYIHYIYLYAYNIQYIHLFIYQGIKQHNE